jgi:hypothetical protein
MVKDPNFQKNLEEYVDKAKPDVHYFEAKGERVRAFVVEMKTADQIPQFAELLFQEVSMWNSIL